MAAANGKATRAVLADRAKLTIADLVLIRIATGGASRAELQRDLVTLLAPRVLRHNVPPRGRTCDRAAVWRQSHDRIKR